MKKQLIITALVAVMAVSSVAAMACICPSAKKGEKKAAYKAPAKSDPSSAKVFSAYLDLRTILAADRGEDVTAASETLVSALKKAQAVAKKDKKQVARAALLGKMAKAAQDVADDDIDLDSARDSFGKLNVLLLDYAITNLSAADAAKYQVFYCSMVDQHWFQKAGEGIGNPYYGASMLKCGEKSTLSAVYSACCVK